MAKVVAGMPGRTIQIRWTNKDEENPPAKVEVYRGEIVLSDPVAPIHDVQESTLESFTGDVPKKWTSGSTIRIDWDTEGEFHYASLGQ